MTTQSVEFIVALSNSQTASSEPDIRTFPIGHVNDETAVKTIIDKLASQGMSMTIGQITQDKLVVAHVLPTGQVIPNKTK